MKSHHSTHEYWKDLPGYEGRYIIFNTGRLVKVDSGDWEIVNPRLSQNGYHLVELCKDGKHRTTTIHRLLAENFIPNPQKKATVNHKNGIKTDNRLENLEWATHSENLLHAIKNGLKKYNKKSDLILAHG